MTEREELKPCKCGLGRDVLQSTSYTVILKCMGCNIEVHAITERDAVSVWNRCMEQEG